MKRYVRVKNILLWNENFISQYSTYSDTQYVQNTIARILYDI